MFKWWSIAVIALFVVIMVPTLVQASKPSNDREWIVPQAVLAQVEFTDEQVRVHNIRNFTYDEHGSSTPRYYDQTFDLNALEKVYYVLSPFEGYVGAAHAFLSFEFSDGKYLAISIEARREEGEEYSAWKGLRRSYELMYVVVDERDAIALRTNVWKDKVYLYPIKADKSQVRELFISMLKRANALAEEPEFYNTLTNSCATNIVAHVNALSPKRIPWSYKILLPAYSDDLAYDLGLIDTKLSLSEARAYYLINDRAQKYTGALDFSAKIRRPGN